MKLNYIVISSNPLKIKFFYEDKKRYGEFYINQTRVHFKDANNPIDKLGITGEFELVGKDKDYGIDLLQGFAEALQTDIHFASHVISGEQEAEEMK